MRKFWMVGAIVLTVAGLLLLVPKGTAGAAPTDFQIEGSTLISYTGTATTVSVPVNVEIIGRSAFENNSKIKKVTIPDSVKTIEEYAFWGCNNLESVSFGKGLWEIPDFTFTGCESLKKVFIPDTIRRIGIMTFADCESLEEIAIPVSVTDIHESAFEGVPNLYILAEEYSYPYRYALERGQNIGNPPVTESEKTDSETHPVPIETPKPTPEPTNRPIGQVMGTTTIVGNKAVIFMDGEDMIARDGAEVDMEKLFPPESYIEDWYYYRDKGLVEMELPRGNVKIGRFGFARSNLKKIILPEGLTTIGYAAFYHCDNLQEIYIPSSVTRIENKAFTFTPWLNNFLTGGDDVQGDSQDVTAGNDSDFLIVGDGILLAYRGNREEVTVPEGVKYVAPEAFLNHKEIKTVNWPDSLEEVDESAFSGCEYKPAF